MDTISSFAGVLGLTERELAILVANPKELKKLAKSLITKDIENAYFFPMEDKDVPKKFKMMTASWRKLAYDYGCTGPVVCHVREGFTLKYHAPLAGPCWQDFMYLMSCLMMKNDEPTRSCYVFFIPQLVVGGDMLTVEEQMKLLAGIRQEYGMPDHHLSTFGSAAMLVGLLLTHFKHTGQRVPQSIESWARSDTLLENGRRFAVGAFDITGGIGCNFRGHDHNRILNLGCFPLGVEFK